MDENYYLHKCTSLIEEKLQWGDSRQWLGSHFDQLSATISRASGIYISRSTLRRLFGREKTYKPDYHPQIATKNALALFLNYQDWEDFTAKVKAEAGVKNPSQPLPLADAFRRNLPKRMLFLVSGASLLTIGLIVYFVWGRGNRVQFSSENPQGYVPLMVGFKYDVSKTNYAKYVISSELRSEAINKENRFYATQFQSPGLYTVKLLGDNRELSAVKVVAYSKGWFPSLLQDNTSEMLPAHLLEHKTGILTFPVQCLKASQVDTTREYWLSYQNIKNFGVSGDDCALECKLLTGPPRIRRDASCVDLPDARIDITGEHGTGYVLFVNAECGQYAQLGFGERAVHGMQAPLQALSQDFSRWRTVRIETRNNVFKLYVENKLVYQFAYRKQIGKVQGLQFTFKWAGSVDDVRLYNHHRQPVYTDSFDDQQLHTRSLFPFSGAASVVSTSRPVTNEPLPAHRFVVPGAPEN